MNLEIYITNPGGNVFALRNLPEEVIAVLFAYYSRSPDDMESMLQKLIDSGDVQVSPFDAQQVTSAKAREFHAKYVIGYGHSSVAEHAIVHLGFERVSMIAAKTIEDCRLGSYTEKSTRYVQFSTESYLRPDEITRDPRLSTKYDALMTDLFATYAKWYEPMKAHIRKQHPPTENQRKSAYESALHAKVCDVLRYLLPASTLTNVGVTVNARTAAHMISKLASSPLCEMVKLAHEAKTEACKVVPTLVKYAEQSPYRASQYYGIDVDGLDMSGLIDIDSKVWVSAAGAETPIAASLLYEASNVNRAAIMGYLLTADNRKELVSSIITKALKDRGAHDSVPRAFEFSNVTFDLLVDFGAYRDIQRHRMASQLAQSITTEHGYVTPDEIVEIGYGDEYRRLMDRADFCHHVIQQHEGFAAQYVVPMAYKRRCVFQMNMREVFQFIELRSAPQGHRSYREIAQELYRQVYALYPTIGQHIRCNMEGAGLERLQAEERAAEKREQK